MREVKTTGGNSCLFGDLADVVISSTRASTRELVAIDVTLGCHFGASTLLDDESWQVHASLFAYVNRRNRIF